MFAPWLIDVPQNKHMPKPYTIVPQGRVQEILQADNHGTDRIEIGVSSGQPLYQEIQIENRFTDDEGKAAALKLGSKVRVTLQFEWG